MKNNDFRILFSIAALMLSLGIFLGAYNIYIKLGIEKPLITELSALEGVRQVHLNKVDKGYEIKIDLIRMDNIQKMHIDINRILHERLKDKDYELQIGDRRNEELQGCFDNLQPAIYEAIAENRYIWLEGQLAKKAKSKGIDYAMYIDKRYLYLQLYDESQYLYEIIERNYSCNLADLGRK